MSSQNPSSLQNPDLATAEMEEYYQAALNMNDDEQRYITHVHTIAGDIPIRDARFDTLTSGDVFIGREQPIMSGNNIDVSRMDDPAQWNGNGGNGGTGLAHGTGKIDKGNVYVVIDKLKGSTIPNVSLSQAGLMTPDMYRELMNKSISLACTVGFDNEDYNLITNPAKDGIWQQTRSRDPEYNINGTWQKNLTTTITWQSLHPIYDERRESDGTVYRAGYEYRQYQLPITSFLGNTESDPSTHKNQVQEGDGYKNAFEIDHSDNTLVCKYPGLILVNASVYYGKVNQYPYSPTTAGVYVRRSAFKNEDIKSKIGYGAFPSTVEMVGTLDSVEKNDIAVFTSPRIFYIEQDTHLSLHARSNLKINKSFLGEFEYPNDYPAESGAVVAINNPATFLTVAYLRVDPRIEGGED